MATIPTGRFVWFEYVSNDERKAQAFFGELFHWKTKQAPLPQGSYTMIALGEEGIGGYVKQQLGTPPHAHWLSHLQVANVHETANKVKSIGGRLVKEPTKIGDMGTMAIIVDPLGATLALWQPTTPQGSGDYRGIDGAWIWNELYSEDPDKSVNFYKAIGGFESETMRTGGSGPGPDRYEVLKSGGIGRAGVMRLQGVPPNWMPYVKVANVDATVEQAKRLGATFKHPPETMQGVGRFAVFADPQGAPIGILQPSPT